MGRATGMSGEPYTDTVDSAAVDASASFIIMRCLMETIL
jgi:hypothetical protein